MYAMYSTFAMYARYAMYSTYAMYAVYAPYATHATYAMYVRLHRITWYHLFRARSEVVGSWWEVGCGLVGGLEAWLRRKWGGRS